MKFFLLMKIFEELFQDFRDCFTTEREKEQLLVVSILVVTVAVMSVRLAKELGVAGLEKNGCSAKNQTPFHAGAGVLQKGSTLIETSELRVKAPNFVS